MAASGFVQARPSSAASPFPVPRGMGSTLAPGRGARPGLVHVQPPVPEVSSIGPGQRRDIAAVCLLGWGTAAFPLLRTVSHALP